MILSTGNLKSDEGIPQAVSPFPSEPLAVHYIVVLTPNDMNGSSVGRVFVDNYIYAAMGDFDNADFGYVVDW